MCAQIQVLLFLSTNLELSIIICFKAQDANRFKHCGQSITEFKKTKRFFSALHLLSMISAQHCIAELTSPQYNNVLDIRMCLDKDHITGFSYSMPALKILWWLTRVETAKKWLTFCHLKVTWQSCMPVDISNWIYYQHD